MSGLRMAHATLDSSARTRTSPRVLVMAKPAWPSTCGSKECAHRACMQVRRHAAQAVCVECFAEIAVGERYVDPGNGLVHESCPERTV